jgi:rhodanese-related sulfurtransferase
LKEAVIASGWPELKDIQGRFVFVLDEGGEKLAAYLEKDPSLAQAIFFVNVPEKDPLAAMMILNDPIKDHQKIQTLVKAGYMVRTRADADTREARTNDTRKMEHAFSSGAQLISTDYYLPDSRMSPDYKVIFPNDAYFRLNPLVDSVETAELTDLETSDAVIALSPKEFKVAMAHDYGTVLDVRTDEEVKGGCLEKAVQADILSGEFEAHLKTMDKDVPVLVYCKVGARSAKAADRLIAEGFRKVYHLDGGIDGWIGSGEETVEYDPF